MVKKISILLLKKPTVLEHAVWKLSWTHATEKRKSMPLL